MFASLKNSLTNIMINKDRTYTELNRLVAGMTSSKDPRAASKDMQAVNRSEIDCLVS